MGKGKKQDDYEVGYGKPPKATQFKAGQSGNPSGRPKGVPNVSKLLKRVLADKVVVTVNGRRQKKLKLEVALTQVMNKAAAGDLKAFDPLMRLLSTAEGAHVDSVADDAETEAMFLDLVLRQKSGAQGDGNE